MKIKTSSNAKTAPSPPPSPPAGPGVPKAAAQKRKCCSTWTCCDYVLLSLLIIGATISILGVVTFKIMAKNGLFEPEEPQYKPATCKVSKIIPQGEVCCGMATKDCKVGMKGSMEDSDWYKFMDGSYNDKSDDMTMTEQWKRIKEFKEEFMSEMRGMKKEGMELDDMLPMEGMEKKGMKEDGKDKRSIRQADKNTSFMCYKIVLEGEIEVEKEHSSEEDSSSEEDNSRDRRQTPGPPRSPHGPRHEGDEGHPHPDGPRKDGPKPRPDGRPIPSIEEGSPLPEGEESVDDKEPRKMIGEPMPEKQPIEAGIVVMGDEKDSEEGIYRAMFYDSTYTMENYKQCSYSACGAKGCKSSVDVEKKMKKWQHRLTTGEEFDCSYMDPREDEHHEHYDFRVLRVAKIPFAAVMLILLIVLIIRRIRACKLRREQCRANCNDRYTVPVSVNVVDSNAKMTKEQEANGVPSAPKMVWGPDALPTYDSTTELPPMYDTGKQSPPPDFSTVLRAWAVNQDGMMSEKEAKEQEEKKAHSEA